MLDTFLMYLVCTYYIGLRRTEIEDILSHLIIPISLFSIGPSVLFLGHVGTDLYQEKYVHVELERWTLMSG